MSWNKPSKRELAVWEYARKLREFHPDDLVKFGIQQSTAQTFMKYWKHRNWICLIRTDASNRKYYCALEYAHDGKEPVSGKATAEGNMWRVMRGRSSFTPTDVAAHANAGGVEVTVSKARSYCQKLLGIGHLRVRETAIPGRREATYSLIEDTGPRAPKLVRLNGLLDPNTDTFYPVDTRVKS